MQEIIEEYGYVIIYVIAAISVIAMLAFLFSGDNFISEWMSNFAKSLGG